jgi:hypothetical protein
LRGFSYCAHRASVQSPGSAPPFSSRCRAMRLDVGRVDHLRLTRSTMRREFAEKPFPDATFSPAHKTIIDGCRRSILGRTVAPPAAALEDMKNAADDAPVIDPLLAAHVPWQMRFDPAPLLITKPKQIAAHLPAPKSPVAGNQQSILTSTLLLGSRPSVRRTISRARRRFEYFGCRRKTGAR